MLHMPTLATSRRRQPPKSDDEFDDMVTDVLRLRHQNPGLTRFGRKGQRQHGIDGYDPVAPDGDGIVWQATLQSDDVLKKIEDDLGLMDAGLPFAPRVFIAALGMTRDRTIQLGLLDMATSRLRGGRCAVEGFFWEDIYDVLIHNHALRRKYYPDDVSDLPQRLPELSLGWSAYEEDEIHPDRKAAKIEDSVLELPVTTVTLGDLQRVLSAEIEDCTYLMDRPSRHQSELKSYRERCRLFLAEIHDDESFRRWHAAEHWGDARWFSLTVGNNGTAPAQNIHARIAPPDWLTFYSEKPKGEIRRFPRRPNFHPLPACLEDFDTRLAMPAYCVPLDSGQFVLRGGPSADLDNGAIDVRVVSIDHRHQSSPLGRFAALTGPIAAGHYSLEYDMFHVETPDWVKGDLRVRLFPGGTKYGYDFPLRELLAVTRSWKL
jgi:hypothetical protein